jgi:hypothetical protein
MIAYLLNLLGFPAFNNFRLLSFAIALGSVPRGAGFCVRGEELSSKHRLREDPEGLMLGLVRYGNCEGVIEDSGERFSLS